MKGYSIGNTLFIYKNDGYRVIERSGDQTIKFLNFEKVEFLLREQSINNYQEANYMCEFIDIMVNKGREDGLETGRQ